MAPKNRVKKTDNVTPREPDPVQAIDYSIEGPGPVQETIDAIVAGDTDAAAELISEHDIVLAEDPAAAINDDLMAASREAYLATLREAAGEVKLTPIDQTLGQAGLGLQMGYPPHGPTGPVTQGSAGMVNVNRRKPTIGRVVHFTLEGEHQLMAAIVTQVYDATTVDLAVFPPGRPATFAVKVVEGEPGISGRCWSWPAMA